MKQFCCIGNVSAAESEDEYLVYIFFTIWEFTKLEINSFKSDSDSQQNIYK